MKKIILIILLILLVVYSLAITGILGYGAATGRFSREMVNQYLATWRGEKLEPPSKPEVVEQKEESPQESSAKIAAAELEREIMTHEMQRRMELLRNMQTTITAAQGKLDKDIQQHQVEMKEFAAQIAQQQEAARKEGFLKALKNYSSMKPKLVKDDFMKMEDEDAVRYLAAMKSDIATAILNQFKNSPEEQAKRLRMMKLLEEKNVIALDQ